MIAWPPVSLANFDKKWQTGMFREKLCDIVSFPMDNNLDNYQFSLNTRHTQQLSFVLCLATSSPLNFAIVCLRFPDGCFFCLCNEWRTAGFSPPASHLNKLPIGGIGKGGVSRLYGWPIRSNLIPRRWKPTNICSQIGIWASEDLILLNSHLIRGNWQVLLIGSHSGPMSKFRDN